MTTQAKTVPTGLERVEAEGYGSMVLTEDHASALHWQWGLGPKSRAELWAEFSTLAYTPEQVQAIAEAAMALSDAKENR